MEVRRLVSSLRRWVWVILVTTLLSGGAAFGISSRQTKLYRATALLVVNQGQAVVGPSYTDVLASQQLATTYASIAISRPVLAAAAGHLGLAGVSVAKDCACLVRGTSNVLQASAVVPPNTQLIGLTVESASPQVAADAANAIAQAFTDAVKESQLRESGSARLELGAQLQDVQSKIRDANERIQALSVTPPPTVPGGSASASLSAVPISSPSANPSPVPSASTRASLSALQSELSQEQATYAALIAQLAQIRLGESKSDTAVRLVDPAVAPSAPFTPRVTLNTALGALLGFLAAASLALLLDYLDDRVRTSADVERVLENTPTLGAIEQMIAKGRRQSGVRPGMLLEPALASSGALEQYRLLRSSLQFASVDRQLKTLAVTSGRPGAGKTTTAANLAVTAAQTGKRVLLVDADMRRSALHRLFEVQNSAGLSTLFLMEKSDPLAVSSETDYENLSLLSSGPPPPNAAELLGSAKMTAVLAKVREAFDLVILDSPPLLVVADAGEIAAQVDGVLLVIDVTKTRPAELSRAVASVQRSGGKVLGVVLNKVDPAHARGNYYGYDYQYGTGAQSAGNAAAGGRRNTWSRTSRAHDDMESQRIFAEAERPRGGREVR